MPSPVLYDYGPAPVDIILVAKRDFSIVVDVEGDRTADTFAASLRPVRSATVTAFTVTVGSYDAGEDSTPVTVTMTDSTLDGLDPGAYLWDLKWTTAGGLERQLAAGSATVAAAVTA